MEINEYLSGLLKGATPPPVKDKTKRNNSRYEELPEYTNMDQNTLDLIANILGNKTSLPNSVNKLSPNTIKEVEEKYGIKFNNANNQPNNIEVIHTIEDDEKYLDERFALDDVTNIPNINEDFEGYSRSLDELPDTEVLNKMSKGCSEGGCLSRVNDWTQFYGRKYGVKNASARALINQAEKEGFNVKPYIVDNGDKGVGSWMIAQALLDSGKGKAVWKKNKDNSIKDVDWNKVPIMSVVNTGSFTNVHLSEGAEDVDSGDKVDKIRGNIQKKTGMDDVSSHSATFIGLTEDKRPIFFDYGTVVVGAENVLHGADDIDSVVALNPWKNYTPENIVNFNKEIENVQKYTTKISGNHPLKDNISEGVKGKYKKYQEGILPTLNDPDIRRRFGISKEGAEKISKLIPVIAANETKFDGEAQDNKLKYLWEKFNGTDTYDDLAKFVKGKYNNIISNLNDDPDSWGKSLVTSTPAKYKVNIEAHEKALKEVETNYKNLKGNERKEKLKELRIKYYPEIYDKKQKELEEKGEVRPKYDLATSKSDFKIKKIGKIDYVGRGKIADEEEYKDRLQENESLASKEALNIILNNLMEAKKIYGEDLNEEELLDAALIGYNSSSKFRDKKYIKYYIKNKEMEEPIWKDSIKRLYK